MSVQCEQSNGIITAEEAGAHANRLLSAEASSFKNSNNVNNDQQKSQDDNGVTRADEEATTSGQIVTSGLVDRQSKLPCSNSCKELLGCVLITEKLIA